MRLRIAVAVVTLVLCPSVVQCQYDFKDLPSNHWANKAVERMQQDGIVIGYPDGSFRGNQYLSRFELAVFFARSQPFSIDHPELHPPDPNGRNYVPVSWEESMSYQGAWLLATESYVQKDLFNDVSSTHWCRSSVNRLAGARMLKGYPDGSFRGDRPISRYEAATAVVQLIDNINFVLGTLPEHPSITPEMIEASRSVVSPLRVRDKPYDDVPYVYWAYEAVNQIAQSGYPDISSKDRYEGTKPTTRYEFAAYLNRLCAETVQMILYGKNRY